MKLRIATFNVENLFRRAAILNLRDSARVDELLQLVKELQGLLDRSDYSNALKDEVFEISHQLVTYVDIRKDAGSLGDWKKENSRTGFRINKSCKGRGDWLGEIVFRAKEFSDQQRKNTGKVIKALNADIQCLVEVEGMDVLKGFNSQVLHTKKFKQFVMIDSPNDPRGIDVACLTRGRIIGIKTHVFDDGQVFKPVFSRDCLEVAITFEGLNQPVFVLCNHFKSQSGRLDADRRKSAARRKDQSRTVVSILKAYDLKKDYVVVLGDLNEDTDNAFKSLDPLFDVEGLHPIVDRNLPATQRYTYHFGGGKKGERLNQLDYIFLSSPLHDAVVGQGFERRGIFEIEKITAKEGAELVKPFPEVSSWDLGASDHAGVWVELDL
ncbi:endonuclease/exonuclease/phosphatase family protein [Achromobacter arsenitoxydans]|uniref:Endonuclease/exonuclease/phosphatase family protein n=1 Tax=Achromobacter arsenitoxydans SY8 TaxID=477184 RepID=H0F6Z2_9BURK|nr:endonuclease [Achromobacter arsenitoxydans]EHK65906.1 endonuclease/exonuclease/phosphatase family protein [Achromobacter arsenitoxydans SY8]